MLRKIKHKVKQIIQPQFNVASLSQPHPLPLPESVKTRQQALDMFCSVSIDGSPAAEIKNYAETDCNRFLYTLSLVSTNAKKLLEIGANPYFTSLLLREFRDAELEFTNYFGTGALQQQQHLNYTNTNGEQKTWDVEYLNINIETDEIPERITYYDHILLCEVIEHMTNDPMFVLQSINKMLTSNGTLILTTPNVARLENVAALIAGANMYDPYSGYGPYGRHNREYTAHELNWLLNYTGFETEVLFTSDVSPSRAGGYCDLQKVEKLIEFRKPDLGQYIFIKAKKVRDLPKALKRPAWLYRSLPSEMLSPLQLSDNPNS